MCGNHGAGVHGQKRFSVKMLSSAQDRFCLLVGSCTARIPASLLSLVHVRIQRSPESQRGWTRALPESASGHFQDDLPATKGAYYDIIVEYVHLAERSRSWKPTFLTALLGHFRYIQGSMYLETTRTAS